MTEFYTKTDSGKFLSITLEKVFSDPSEWDGSFIIVRVGSENFVPSSEDLEQLLDALLNCDALLNVKDASILMVGAHENVQFEKTDFKKLER
jgi:hypothetical protein